MKYRELLVMLVKHQTNTFHQKTLKTKTLFREMNRTVVLSQFKSELTEKSNSDTTNSNSNKYYILKQTSKNRELNLFGSQNYIIKNIRIQNCYKNKNYIQI